jgi:glycosyltransferase involved in cell wall biosynthesis
MNDLISIIIPVYNMEKYLDRCVHSVLNQTYENLEIILVDDGSTDNSPNMCDNYALKDSRIKVVHKENGGLSDARNAGLRIATGDYIGYVDSDDWIEPNMYECMYKACAGNNAQLAVCRYFREYDDKTVDDGTSKVEIFSRDEILRIYITDKEGYMVYNSVWSKLFKRELVEGMLFPKGKNSEDIMYTTKAFCKLEKAAYIDTCLYHYVIDRKDSIMNINKTQRMFRDELPFWQEHIKCIRENVSDYMGDLAQCYYYKRLMSYYMEIVGGDHKSACKLADMIKSDKTQIKRICSKSNNIVSKGDRVRIKLFVFNHVLYRECFARFENIIVPIKAKMRRRKNNV